MPIANQLKPALSSSFSRYRDTLLDRRHKITSDRPAKGQGTFRDYDLGFIHIDIKHLPKLQTTHGERRNASYTLLSTGVRIPLILISHSG